MRKLSESVWGDVRRRAEGQDIRKEDTIGNLAELKPVDMGGSVLWANQELVVEGECLFTWDEANELIGGQAWRLPTKKEVAELDGINRYYDKEYIYFGDDRKLAFRKSGTAFIFHGIETKLDEYKVFYGWTSEPYEFSAKSIHALVIDDYNLSYSPLNKRISDQVTKDKDSKCSVRLVKNK